MTRKETKIVLVWNLGWKTHTHTLFPWSASELLNWFSPHKTFAKPIFQIRILGQALLRFVVFPFDLRWSLEVLFSTLHCLDSTDSCRESSSEQTSELVRHKHVGVSIVRTQLKDFKEKTGQYADWYWLLAFFKDVMYITLIHLNKNT